MSSIKRYGWAVSCVASLLLLVVLVAQWRAMNDIELKEQQPQISAEFTDRFIKEQWDDRQQIKQPGTKPAQRVPTGIFIQSLDFFNSSEVYLTGYVWQRYSNDGSNNDVKPAPGEVGFVFPEQVESQFTATEAYRRKTTNGEVIGWYFEATLRQPFDYELYPFDHKTVWVRLWHHEFDGNVVLVPDYAAYDGTGLEDIFGIEKSIVLGGWERRDTYFNYRLTNYDTNFGLPDYVGKQDFPELHYNIVIQRKFENAFIVHLLPLLLVAALLFGMLLTVNDDEDFANRHGFNTAGMIGTCSALFFVVLLAHIQLRKEFAGANVVYLEYFYMVMYAALAVVAACSYLFSQRALTFFPFNRWPNALPLKLLFWPTLLGTLAVLTAFKL